MLRRCETDSYSTASMASKASREKQKSSSRFSLRRLNPFRSRSFSSKSVRSARSVSEIETRSVSSVQTSSHSQAERELAPTPSALSMGGGDEVSSISAAGGGRGKLVECPLCLSLQPGEVFPMIMTCHHRSCRECLRQYLRIEIMESRINIACPECAEKFHPNDIAAILDDGSLMKKYEEFMLRRVLVSEPDARWCPAPDCGFAVIASGCASCPKLRCERPGCDTCFCYHCKQYWHPNQTCDAARAERASQIRSSSLSYSHESSSQNDIKPCPRCGAFIIKMDDGSCNHMTCAVCGAEFCWLCMKEISDLHYLSPSGCTFWGKKPWSRKKKILWQLGTLVGAPVGIGLVAGIAVPAMIIGLPVWVGRKLHTKYEHAPKHKRNLVITGGVSASILISPILAGLAVGIGVPILLAYVYGVVPISLCRSGGCGVTTTNSGGVRFDFDDDNEVTVGVSGPYPAGDAHSVETTSHLANPSIGPSIGEMSVAMTNSLSASGSHIDRVGAMRDESDRDSASNRPLVGTSLNGSLSGSAVAGPSGFQNKMEVHADVTTNPNRKRASLSSDSANLSLDAKSATVSFCDDASMRALAGSICNRDKDGESMKSVKTMEVQVDMASSSARYRHSSGVGGERAGGAKSKVSSPGSPTSTRSVSFLADEQHYDTYGRSTRYKRQSLSVGDKINEHAERHLERMSVRSFDPETDCELDTGVGAHGCGAGHKLAAGHGAVGGVTSCASKHHQNSPRCSMSLDCMASHQHGRVPGVLPEVDSDRPVLYVAGSLALSSSTESTSNDTVSLVPHEDATDTWQCTPTSEDRPVDGWDESTPLSPDDSTTSHSSWADIAAPSRRRTRRVSCERAMQDGRLSPDN